MEPTTALSVLYPALRAKKLSWADHVDHTEQLQDICSQPRLTLSQLAQVMHLLLARCELDTTKTAHHFQIEDTFVDIMYRDHVLISVSKKRPAPQSATTLPPVATASSGPDTEAEEEEEEETGAEAEEDEEEKAASDRGAEDDDNSSASAWMSSPTEDDDDEETKTEVREADDDEEERLEDWEGPTLTDAAKTVLPLGEAAGLGEDDANAWQEVVSKRTRQIRGLRHNLARLNDQTFYFFANEANVNYMDFVGLVQGVKGLLEAAQRYRWSHGYHLEGNTVYDFNDPAQPGVFRYFIPNTAYMHKFKVWFDAYCAAGHRVPEDTRVFYVFRENSLWHKWTLLGQLQGLSAVRQKLLSHDAQYGHAYCLETNDLANFWLKDGHFLQQLKKAPAKYLTRFEAYLHLAQPTGEPDDQPVS